LDPTVTTGVPLWRGRRTLWPTPAYGEPFSKTSPLQNNVFEDFIFWARQKDLFPCCASGNSPKGYIPVHVLLHFVCAEWMTMVDYIKTRLYQLEWEIDRPQYFTVGNRAVDNALERLHIWRRLVSLYREMIPETVQNLERLSERTRETFSGQDVSPHQGDGAIPGNLPTGEAQTDGHVARTEAKLSLMSHYEHDFSSVLSQLDEYQKRIDRLTTVVTGIISIEDSRRGIQDNHNIGRLTWLATIFIPLSLISGILSMQADVTQIGKNTFTVYFATSIPLAVVIAAGAGILSVSRSQYKSRKYNNAQKTG
jgi:Mg2+ and Co2+ transporter CorA